MAQTLFYVARNGKQEGPISLDAIVERVNTKTLDPSDYLYDEEKKDWVMLMAHPPLSERLKGAKPVSAPAAPQKKVEPDAAEWYVLKDNNKFGPFGHTEVVKMLQEKSLREFDYVWHAKLPSWERVASVPDFSPDSMKQLKDSGVTGLNEIFFRRRHARAEYGASILLHDNKRVYKGQSVEVSAGGAGIVVENGSWKKGDQIYMHFKPGDGVPPFNAVCEIVSKKGSGSEKYQYGVKFTSIPVNTAEQINEFARQRAA